jgi:long-chain-fatty-acid--[acyl-carrier-protein] ligase
MATFLSAFGIGYCKFFALEFITEHYFSLEDKDWIIQLIGSIMTLGPFIVFPLSAPLSEATKKNKMLFITSGMTAAVLIVGFILNWAGSVWLYLFLIGLITGAFSVGKMASVPLEAKKGLVGDASEEKERIYSVNAGLTIIFIIGMLLGLFCGSKFYYTFSTSTGVLIAISVFLFSGVSGYNCKYENETTVPLPEAFEGLIVDSLTIIVRYPLYLVSSPILWGIASALSLAVTAYATIKGLGTESECSLMPLYAAIGIIIGNVLSTKYTAFRYKASLITGALMSFSIPLVPIIVNMGLSIATPQTMYWLTSAFLIIIGGFFGCCTNLIDSEFLNLVGKEGKEGIGAAIQSVFLSFFTFLIGGGIGLAIVFDWVGLNSQFFLLSVLSLIGVFFVFVLALIRGAMKNEFLFFLKRFFAFVLSLRYKVEVKGDQLDSTNSYLVLPNHPAEIDPLLLVVSLWDKVRLSPVVDEMFYNIPILTPLFNLIKAIPMPDLSAGAGYYKKLRVDRSLQQTIDVINEGGNILLYPSGHLTRDGLEHLGAASGTKTILDAIKNDNCKVVLVRSEGIWGSSFSTAQSNGDTPDLFKVLGVNIFSLIKNFIFFIPKRKVTLTLKIMDISELPTKDTKTLNRYFEEYYNQLSPEPNLVSYKFWDKQSKPDVDISSATIEVADISSADDKVKDDVVNYLAELLEREPDTISFDKQLANDLSMDSLELTEVLMWLNEEYCVDNLELNQLKTVADIIAYASKIKVNEENEVYDETPEKWLRTRNEAVMIPCAKTLHEALLLNLDRLPPKTLVMADDATGILTAKKFKIGVMLFADEIRKLEGKYVAVMLPASVGASITIFATLLAGKVPVMLNWTTGKKNLLSAINDLDIKSILTSGKFLDKITQTDFSGIEDLFVFLEEVKKTISFDRKVVAAINSKITAEAYLQKHGLNKLNEEDTAVVLFTSGSETTPKAVPLSHKNVISNISEVIKIAGINQSDSLLGFLPPFHSFGFTVTTVLPVISGVKVAFYPNPTEGSKIAFRCEKWRPTLMAGTPSFIKIILSYATKEQVKSLKTIVTGAEKAPKDLFDLVGEICDAELLEGYGITECSPVISCNLPYKEKKGVGYVVDNLQIKIVNPDNYEPVELGEQGLILVSGPSVFTGYLNTDANPFIDIDGIKWYNTADLGFLDANRYLTLSGRLKRFVKISGEMISLPAIEEALNRGLSHIESEVPITAIDYKENDSIEVVLFSAYKELTKEQANKILRDAGFSSLYRVHRLVILDEIPLLGTGKIDYRSLKEIIK